MVQYNLAVLLSSLDFELLTKDLLQAELGILFESFREGKDGGIDLRHAPVTGSLSTIVQCKRYQSDGFATLKSKLKTEELPKIKKLKPGRYILSASVKMSPQQKDEIKAVLSPFVLSTADIYSEDEICFLLNKYSEIERRHPKLWIQSVGVLESILNAEGHAVSREELEATQAAAKIYVKNPSFDEALEILREEKVCIISGIPGIGKTTLARMLMLYYVRAEYDLVKIESNISEARRASYNDRPRFFLYDDFLGQTASSDKLENNEDAKLLAFMGSINESKSSVLVMTTREYILNQAKDRYEKIARENFDHRNCVVDLSKYTRRTKAQILYNHLHFCGLPQEYLKAFVLSQGYIAVVDHKNYNPRIIGFVASKAVVKEVDPGNYTSLFIEKLNNPDEIWAHAYENQIDGPSQMLLLVLASLHREVSIKDLGVAFDAFSERIAARYNQARGFDELNKSIKILDGTFTQTKRVKGGLAVEFQNPSIRDFMRRRLMKSPFLNLLIETAIFFEQVEWFFRILIDKKVNLDKSELRRFQKEISEKLISLFPSAPLSGVGIYIHGVPQIYIRHRDHAERLATVARAAKRVRSKAGRNFVDAELVQLAALVESGEYGHLGLFRPISMFHELGYFDRASGMAFVAAVKNHTIEMAYYPQSFETIKDLHDRLPSAFTENEIENLCKLFKDSVVNYARNIESQGGDDPEGLRDEVIELESLASRFGVDIGDEKLVIEERATKIESDQEEKEDPATEEREEPEEEGEEFSDDEMISMFSTL
jgi:hypothetical protein